MADSSTLHYSYTDTKIRYDPERLTYFLLQPKKEKKKAKKKKKTRNSEREREFEREHSGTARLCKIKIQEKI